MRSQIKSRCSDEQYKKENPAFAGISLVGEVGLEPTRIATLDPKLSVLRSYAGLRTFCQDGRILIVIAGSLMVQ